MSLNTGSPCARDVGYRISGVGAACAVSRQVALTTRRYVIADGVLLVGGASVPVVGGSASVPILGLPGHVGVGLAF